MTKLEKMLAVVEAARKVVDTPIYRVPSEHILVLADALADLDAHTEADAETLTLAVWQVHQGENDGLVVFAPTHFALDEATRLGTTQITITREGGR